MVEARSRVGPGRRTERPGPLLSRPLGGGSRLKANEGDAASVPVWRLRFSAVYC